MEKIESYPLDHYGLIASICDELAIPDRIDKLIGSKDPRRIVQPGTAVKAMIINTMGFSGRTLYLTPHFFESKPIELLFGQNLKTEDLNAHALGKALDEIFEYGPTNFFAQIAFGIAKDNDLLGKTVHLDSTSFSMQGVYDLCNEDPFTEPITENPQHTSTEKLTFNVNDAKETAVHEPINVTYGYSKAKRPDLKQVMLSMVMNGPANLPIWMEGQDGNSSDKVSFQKTIAAVQAFKEQLDNSESFMWVADSALYSKEAILNIKDYTWITRVPETLTECINVLNKEDKTVQWIEAGNGYKFHQVSSNYANIRQRWLVIYSQQAYEREYHTLETRINKEEQIAVKACKRLGKKVFDCSNDANEYLKEFIKGYKYHTIEAEVVEVLKHSEKGRPKKGAVADIIRYRIEVKPVIDLEKKTQALNKKGKFVLATNELDEEILPAENILKTYKEQQSVERGFRFLKDPYFMADDFFLKSPKRIEALMVVMCLCLLVYNFAQHRLRTALEESNETLPNQKKKEVKNPTMRWIFQIMAGIAWIQIFDNSTNDWKSYVTNINPVREKIIRIFGKTAKIMYKIE